MPRYLIAADANWILDEIRAALEGPDTTITVCRTGKQVVPTVRVAEPDLAVLDLQIGTMGGMAVTMSLRQYLLKHDALPSRPLVARTAR